MIVNKIFAVLNTLALRGVGSAIAVLYTLVVSHYLTTESASYFFFLFNVCTIASICFRWGLDEVIVRRVAISPKSQVVNTSRYLIFISHRRVILWLLVSIFALVFFSRAVGFWVAPEKLFNVLIAIFSAAFVALSACMARVMQGKGDTNIACVYLNIAIPGLSLLYIFTLAFFKEPDARDLIIAYLVIAVVVYLISMRSYNLLSGVINGLVGEKRGGESSSANKLGAVVFSQQIIIWTALLIIPYAYSDGEYKEFVVIQKIATLISLVMLAVNFTFARKFASLYAKKRLHELRVLIFYSLCAILFSSIICTAILVAIQGWFFEYSKIPPTTTCLLIVLVASQIFFSISALFSLVLSMANDENFLFINQTIINLSGAGLFAITSLFLTLELVSFVMVISYLILSLSLGMRVVRLTTPPKVETV